MSQSDEAAHVLSDPQRLSALAATGLMQSAADAAFDRYAWLASKVTGAPIALVSLVDDERQMVRGSHGFPEPWASAAELPLTHSLCKHTVAAGRPLVVNDTREHPLVRDSLAISELGLQAYLGVPLLTASGQALGTVSVAARKPRAWQPDDVRALRELASLLMPELEQGARMQGAAARSCVMYRGDGLTPLSMEELPFTRALCGEMVPQSEIFVRMPDYPEGRWHRISATPLRDGNGQVRGAIVVGSDVTEQRMAQERLAQTVEALRLLALLDELTGLHNRRGFMALAEQQIKMADQTGRSLLIFFADLDDLKQINDRFGHEAGDQALRDAGRLLRATFRDSDLLARLGGDEFVVLACDANLGDADLFAARLHAALRAYNAMSERRFALSISTGATAYDPRSPEPIETLLKRADAAMYKDKRLRRSSDRVRKQ